MPVSDGVELRVFATEELTAEHRRQVIDVCIRAHAVQDFENLFTFIPSGGRHVLAFEGPALVAHAVATTRWLQPEGLPELWTAYIDAVSTVPERQGRGIGSAVMERLAAEVGDHDVACLQTDRVSFYARIGWELWRGPLAGRDGTRLIPTPEQRGVMVLRLPRTPPLDLDRLLTIERQPSRIWE